MTDLVYPDAYLSRFCDDDREERAYAAVDQLATFDTSWRDSLTILKCYIIACLENQADSEDLFSAKLKNYTKEFNGLLEQARVAQAEIDGTTSAVFSVPMERG